MAVQYFKKVILLFSFIAISFFTLAQEGIGEIDIVDSDKSTHNNATWYNQPWFWIVGTIAFILLLLVLLKNTRVPKDQKRV